jgi:hypothetical protein
MRVVRPGGWVTVQVPNFCSFFEQHYNVLWAPLLPKWAARWYLRLRGRDVTVLNEYITYTTFLGMRRWVRRLEGVRVVWVDRLEAILWEAGKERGPKGWMARRLAWLRRLGMVRRVLEGLWFVRLAFGRSVRMELLKEPAGEA